jgi:hypothetical protein
MHRKHSLALYITIISSSPLLFGCAAAPIPRASDSLDPGLDAYLVAPQLPPSLGIGGFGGLGVGESKFHDYELGGLPGAHVDDTATSFSAFAGYRWTPNYGMLLGYIDHGQLSASGPVGDGGQPFTDKIKYKSVIMCGMASAPVARGVAVFGLAGAAYWDQSVKYSEEISPGLPPQTSTDSSIGVSPTIGGGVNYFFDSGGHFGLNLTWIHIFGAGDKSKTDHDSDIDFATLGFVLSQ